MRRALLIVLLGVAAVALLVGAATAAAKSAAFKTGTYSLKPAGYTVTLKHEQCGGKLQFCVALPKSPNLACQTPGYLPARVGNFTTPVALPSSGKLAEHAPITAKESPVGGPLPTGQSTFSIAFKK